MFSKTLFSMLTEDVEEELNKDQMRKSVVLFGIMVCVCVAIRCVCVCAHAHASVYECACVEEFSTNWIRRSFS